MSRILSETTQIRIDPGRIDFGIGQPQLDLLPRELLWRASQRVLAETDNTSLNYGHAKGDIRFRAALADFLAADYEARPDPSTFVTTNGASGALALVAEVFASSGDTILVEEPTYFLAHQIFRDRGLNIVSVPLNSDGLDLEALEKAVKVHNPAFFYTIPTFQNPTGQSMSRSTREALVNLADQLGFLIVADEVYQLLHYGAAPPPPLASYLESDTVVSIGSFSKILAPGLRLGWIQTSSRWQERLLALGLFKSGGGLNHFLCRVVGEALRDGGHRLYTDQLRRIYSSRVDVMDRRLQATMGDLVRYRKPGGGYFFWLELPSNLDAAALEEPARQAGTGFRRGSLFSTEGGLNSYLRLSFAYYHENAIDVGVDRLAGVVRKAFA